MTFLRKHAAGCALLSVLCCAAAAPYLLPADPDSAVFRSGALPLLLLLACFMPAGGALKRAERGTLLRGLLLGFFFALALSLGSELAFYGELLPGARSLLRRVAVPLLAAPLTGLLFARLAMLTLHGRRQSGGTLPFACAIFLFWLPVLLAYWPGMLNYDFAGEFAQHAEGYSAIHPLLHSAFQNGILRLFESGGDYTRGLLALSLLQMALFSLSLGRACAFVRARAGLPAALFCALLFALHPVFSVLSCSMTKDTLFAAALLTLSLDLWELLEGRRFTPLLILRILLCAVSVALLRTNGPVCLVPLLLLSCAAAKGLRGRMALLGLGCAAASLCVQLALQLLLSPAPFPGFQFYSVPAQQLVRAHAEGTLTEEEAAELRAWYTDEAGLAVHPHLADPAKGYLDRARLETNGRDFLSLWARAAGHSIKPYAEAFLQLNIGSWYPDDKSHATIYPDVSWNDKGYLQTQELDIEGFETTSLLPGVQAFYEQICRRNGYQKWPMLSLLFAPAVPFWVLLFAGMVLCCRGRRRLTAPLFGALALWAGYLLGPCTLPRYLLPLFCLTPVALSTALAVKQKG